MCMSCWYQEYKVDDRWLDLSRFVQIRFHVFYMINDTSVIRLFLFNSTSTPHYYRSLQHMYVLNMCTTFATEMGTPTPVFLSIM